MTNTKLQSAFSTMTKVKTDIDRMYPLGKLKKLQNLSISIKN